MILVNGIVTDCVGVTDRGLMYGDGVFRTMRVRDGELLCWQQHYRKLEADCHALGIPCPGQEELLLEASGLATRMLDCVLKIVVTRGQGGRGYAASAELQPTRILLTSPLPPYPDDYVSAGVRVRLCETRLAFQPRLAGIKHLNRLENVLARQEWNDPGIAEGLMLDAEGNVIEGTMTNIFVSHGEVLWTPDLSRCGVAGVQRDRLMDAAASAGIPVRVANLSLADVLAADEIILCNSVVGLWQVRECAGRTWPAGNRIRQFRQALES